MHFYCKSVTVNLIIKNIQITKTINTNLFVEFKTSSFELQLTWNVYESASIAIEIKFLLEKQRWWEHDNNYYKKHKLVLQIILCSFSKKRGNPMRLTTSTDSYFVFKVIRKLKDGWEIPTAQIMWLFLFFKFFYCVLFFSFFNTVDGCLWFLSLGGLKSIHVSYQHDLSILFSNGWRRGCLETGVILSVKRNAVWTFVSLHILYTAQFFFQPSQPK